MKVAKMTLKQYITSQNYRRQVESSNKKRHKIILFRLSRKTKSKQITLPQEYLTWEKVKEIKIFARAVIQNDVDFIAIERLIEDLKDLFLNQIQSERNNQELMKSIIEIGSNISKSKIQSKIETSVLLKSPILEKNKQTKLFNPIMEMTNSGKTRILDDRGVILQKPPTSFTSISDDKRNNFNHDASQTQKNDVHTNANQTTLLKRYGTLDTRTPQKSTQPPQNELTSTKFIPVSQSKKK